MASRNCNGKAGRNVEGDVGRWGWLFPITYFVHILEEYGGGEGFPSWSSRTTGVVLTPARFLVLSGVGWSLMLLGAVLALRIKSLRWVFITLGTVVLINSLSHVVDSLIHQAYSPGLVSGLILWVPLGVFTLRRLRRRLPARAFAMGILIGVGIQGIVTLLTLWGRNG